MRSVMKKTVCILLAVFLLVMTVSCGKAEPDPNSGLYVGTTAELGGVSVDLNDVFSEVFSIELRDGGEAVFNYEGQSYGLKWTLEGNRFHASGGGAELEGILENGVLVLEDVLGSGLTMNLERQAS